MKRRPSDTGRECERRKSRAKKTQASNRDKARGETEARCDYCEEQRGRKNEKARLIVSECEGST